MPFKNPKSPYVKCRGCGKKMRRGLAKYCPNCAPLDRRLLYEPISPQAKKSFWACIRKYGRKCRLSGVSLEINDNTGPWYLVFSHLISGYKNGILPAAALFNEMKAVLTKRLFRYYVLALHDRRKKHLKVKKRPVKHWRMIALLAQKGICPVCGQPVLKGHKFCARCSRIVHRMKLLRFPRKAIEGVLAYLHTYGFVCYYTGMPLNLDDPKSPWYLVFDHWMPRDPRKIVVTSALVNKMKDDLTEDEFWYFIGQLARFYRYGTPVKKIKLKFWRRPYRSPKASYRTTSRRYNGTY